MNQRCENEGFNQTSECIQERVCDNYIVHDVEHIVPIHTQIVNHHIYRHHYKPVYTCSSCDVIENCCM